jgi:hypothetical protein
MRVEKFVNWVCCLAVVGFAIILSAGVVVAVHEGRVSGGKSKVVHLLAQDPVGFWSALGINLFMAGIFWYGAYWIYIRRIKKQNGP